MCPQAIQKQQVDFGFICKELRSHHCHPYNKTETENQQLLQGPSRKQVLYLNHAPSPFCFSLFSDRILCSPTPGTGLGL
jgi:hypothetical protein